MESITERLGRFPRFPLAPVWGAGAAILFGAAVGGAIAGTQLSSESDKGLYWGVVGVVVLLGVVCALAALATHSERTDSVQAIKVDLEKLLSGEVGDDA
jgi:CHASE2 domain-containing sensor protein